MKKNRAYLKPYIRKAKEEDFNPKNASDLSVCIRGVYYKTLPRCYVLVQRGSNKVIEFAESKDELKRRVPNTEKNRNKKFNQWRNMIKHYAQNH